MNLLHWIYTRNYQIKAVFDTYPDMLIIFRTVGHYYFIYTTRGRVSVPSPSRKDYVEMELLLNLELEKLTAYLNKKNQSEVPFVKSWIQKKGLPTSISLEVFPYTK